MLYGEFYNPESGETLTAFRLCKRFNVSLAANATSFQGWHLLHDTARPLPAASHKIIAGPPQEREGLWYRTWLEEPLSAEELAAAREELFKTLRQARDEKLAATDFMLMADYPIDEAKRARVIAYRQALRDLPSLEGAPWDGGGSATPWPTLEA